MVVKIRPRRAVLVFAAVGATLAAALHYLSRPTVWFVRDPFARYDTYPPTPIESVRVFASTMDDPTCLPIEILGRIHVKGGWLRPSDGAVARAILRLAADSGAHAIAPPGPWTNDLPVLGKLDILFGEDIEADDRERWAESHVGRAIVLRCRRGAPRRPR